jgi:hypothetical protein
VGPETYFEVFPAAAMVVFACFAATPARKKASLMIIPAALYYILLIAGLIIYRFGPWFEPTVYYFIMLLLSLATSCVYALTLAGTIRRKAPAAICIGVMALLTLIQDYLMPFQTIGLAKYLHISLSNSLFLLLHVATDITPFLFLISLLTIVLNLEKRAVTASGGRPI